MHKTILLVDDEPGIRLAFSDILRLSGYEVIAKPDAASALAAIREGAMVDLIITDHCMPGMNGTEFIEVCRKEVPAAPVIMLTAYGSVENYLETMSSGVFEYVSKPVLAKELRRIVQAALESAKTDPAGMLPEQET